MSLTRKHYVMIADALRSARETRVPQSARGDEFAFAVNAAALEIARRLAQENPRFDTARFLRAAGAVTEESQS